MTKKKANPHIWNQRIFGSFAWKMTEIIDQLLGLVN